MLGGKFIFMLFVKICISQKHRLQYDYGNQISICRCKWLLECPSLLSSCIALDVHLLVKGKKYFCRPTFSKKKNVILAFFFKQTEV